jgi:hypothetical protein
MKLRFNSVTGGVMSHTLTAIISKFVTQEPWSVNQTMVITAYFLFLFTTLSVAIGKIQRLWCVSECECGALVNWHWRGKLKYFVKYITLPFCPPQFQHKRRSLSRTSPVTVLLYTTNWFPKILIKIKPRQ